MSFARVYGEGRVTIVSVCPAPCSCLRRENILGRVPLYDLIAELAATVGRIRCRLGDDDYSGHLGERAAFLVDCLDAMVCPCAAEVYQANLRYGVGEQEAVGAALEDVDRRAAVLARLIGGPSLGRAKAA